MERQEVHLAGGFSLACLFHSYHVECSGFFWQQLRVFETIRARNEQIRRRRSHQQQRERMLAAPAGSAETLYRDDDVRSSEQYANSCRS